MDLVELGARSMDLVDLEFLELGCLAGKKWSGAVFWIWSCVELSQTRPRPDTHSGCRDTCNCCSISACLDESPGSP
jgi:hypothetical protein